MSPSTGEERTGQDGAAAGAEAGQAVPEPGAVPPPKSWKEMRDWAAQLLQSRTGQDVAAWNRRVAEAGPPDEQAFRAWLEGQGVTGYGQALLVSERFGYPDFLPAEADELIEGQYSDRPQLRPVSTRCWRRCRWSARRRYRPAGQWSASLRPAAPSAWSRRRPRAAWTSACGWGTSAPAAACSPPGISAPPPSGSP
jgi:hypothetical protein